VYIKCKSLIGACEDVLSDLAVDGGLDLGVLLRKQIIKLNEKCFKKIPDMELFKRTYQKLVQNIIFINFLLKTIINITGSCHFGLWEK
jgi:hypothetical protein